MLSRRFFIGAIITTGIFAAAAVPKNTFQFAAVVIGTVCAGGVVHDVVTAAAAPSSSFAAAVAFGAGADCALSRACATLGGGGIFSLGIFRLGRNAGVFFRSCALSSP